jgi:hypothetical protein
VCFGLVVVSVSKAGSRPGQTPPEAASHPFAVAGMERFDTNGRSGSIRRGDHAIADGVMTCTTRADRCWRAAHAARRRM